MALEGMAAEVLALQSRSAAKDLVLERREAETRSMEAGIKKGDLDRWAAADDQFHNSNWRVRQPLPSANGRHNPRSNPSDKTAYFAS